MLSSNSLNYTISGTASDASGIYQVTVNGVVATGTTSWSATIPMVTGSNTLTVIAKDNSSNRNSKTQSLTVTAIQCSRSNWDSVTCNGVKRRILKVWAQ